MNDKTEITQVPATENLPTDTTSPAYLLAVAVEKGADIEQLKQLMDLKREWEKDEAKKAYMVAVANFKADPPKIIKDKYNGQYKSYYASLSNLVNSALPKLSENGLSHRWDIDQSDGIKVSCILTHILGHSESVPMSAPADDSGKKNAIQQIKSTITYLKGATFEAITGLATDDFNQDDDGNGAGIEPITEDQLLNLEALITEVGAKRDSFLKILKVEKLADLPAIKYDGAIKRLEKKRSQK